MVYVNLQMSDRKIGSVINHFLCFTDKSIIVFLQFCAHFSQQRVVMITPACKKVLRM